MCLLLRNRSIKHYLPKSLNNSQEIVSLYISRRLFTCIYTWHVYHQFYLMTFLIKLFEKVLEQYTHEIGFLRVNIHETGNFCNEWLQKEMEKKDMWITWKISKLKLHFGNNNKYNKNNNNNKCLYQKWTMKEMKKTKKFLTLEIIF